MRHGLRPHSSTRIREVVVVVLAALATSLTAFVGYAVFDMATTTYVGYEIGLTRTVAIVAALLAATAWTGVVVLRRSAPRRPGGG